ncbi:RICIN domain-containing protein [Streptomyces sp. NPDC006739]|uniref:MmyB family transcriptional regulator n=1 Tax=Streptomyces sp. NPDC006739 TaxID=3364763 RepID=UPI0036AA69E1
MRCRLYRDWEKRAAHSAAHLRAMAGADPDTPELTQLVGELVVKSPEFARLWERYDVLARGRGQKHHFQHPEVGSMRLGHEVMAIFRTDGQRLVPYQAAPRTPDHDAAPTAWSPMAAPPRTATPSWTPWDGGTKRQWQLRYQGGGKYWIVNRATGLVLDGGGNVPSGSVTKRWSGSSSSNVQWTFTAVWAGAGAGSAAPAPAVETAPPGTRARRRAQRDHQAVNPALRISPRTGSHTRASATKPEDFGTGDAPRCPPGRPQAIGRSAATDGSARGRRRRGPPAVLAAGGLDLVEGSLLGTLAFSPDAPPAGGRRSAT